MSGYALLHRTLLEHPAFRNGAEAMAFGWMILRASWRPIDVRYKGHRISLQRGQLAISQRDMAFQMDRDKGWIERLWKRLKAEAMIEADVKAGVAIITICNFDKYQQIHSQGKAANGAGEATVERQTQGSGKAQNNEGKELKSSEANASACPAHDLRKQVFDLGLSLVMLSGKTEGEARQMVGLWRKGKTDAEVLAGFLDCQAQDISDPLPWLQARFKTAKWVSASGYEYRGSDLDVMREAERRNDMNTYWAVKAKLKDNPKPPAKPKDRRGGTKSIGDLLPLAAGGRA